MMAFLDDQAWGRLFDPTHPLLNSVLRGTIVYLGLFLVLRLVKNRRAGGLGISDLLLVTLTANGLQNALIGKGNSITEGGVTTLTVFFWSFVLDWINYRFPRLRHLVHSGPEQVIRNGVILQAGLRREMLTENDLLSHLRLNGISDLSKVHEAYVEENGQLSVVQRC